MDFTFNFTEQQVNLLLAGLGELPAKLSLSMIQEIHKQVQEQQKQEQPKEEQYACLPHPAKHVRPTVTKGD